MGSNISIWSPKKVNQEKVLLDLTRAAFRCGYSFSLNSVEKKRRNGKVYLIPDSFMIPPQKEGQEWLSFGFAPIQEQVLEVKRHQYFKHIDGKEIDLEIYYLAATDNVDVELLFRLTYEYLKINKTHLAYIDFVIDWPLMQKIYSEGYSETWCWRKQ